MDPTIRRLVAGRWRGIGLTALALAGLGCISQQPAPVAVQASRMRVLDGFERQFTRPIIHEKRLVAPSCFREDGGLGFFKLKGDSPPRMRRIQLDERTWNAKVAGRGGDTWWIRTCDRRWLVLDKGLNVRKTPSFPEVDSLHPPIVLDGRAVVYGYAGIQATGTESAFLFELTEQGDCVPILEYSSGADELRRVRESQWHNVLGGGLGRSPDDGFAFTDPRDFRIYIYDRNAVLQRVIDGANPRWRPPEWSAVEPATPDPETEDAWWMWGFNQITPKAPVFLDTEHIAVLVGYPSAGGMGQSLELDVYRIDGTVVAAGVPVPQIEGVGQLFVVPRTDPMPGNEIVVSIEPVLPYPLYAKKSPPEIWSIKVTMSE